MNQNAERPSSRLKQVRAMTASPTTVNATKIKDILEERCSFFRSTDKRMKVIKAFFDKLMLVDGGDSL